MAKEEVSLRASGGQRRVSRRLLSLPRIFGRIHCQAFPRHCLNYISQVFGGKGCEDGKET